MAKEYFNEKIELSSYNAISRKDYSTIIQRLLAIEQDHSTKKTDEDYRLLRRYEILEVNVEGTVIHKLIKRGSNGLRFACKEELFDILQQKHLELGHSGRDKMFDSLSKTYANMTIGVIAVYLALCETCQLKKPAVRKGVVVKPIISNFMNNRGQADLIDMQSEADGSYRFILTYQDHLTKFCVLRALKTKTAEEVAYQLVDIFCLLGAPVIMHTDNGGEFTASRLVDEIVTLWPQCKQVHGAPRHSQSQGSVERQNQEVRKMLVCWKRDNNTTKWTEGLRIVQWQINARQHQGIGRNPYKAMFGTEPKLGMQRTGLPDEALALIYNEEQLGHALKGADNEQQDAPSTTKSGQKMCIKCGQEGADDEFGTEEMCALCEVEIVTAEERAGAKERQMKQADRMLASSGKRFPLVEVGSTVMVPIPDVDRGRAEFPNIKAVVLEVSEEGMHKLGTEQGVLGQRFAANQFTPCSEKFLAKENVPPGKEISVRQAAREASMGRGQGFFKCGCAKGCRKASCKCFKNNVLCNSKCHNSNPCDNKNESAQPQ